MISIWKELGKESSCSQTDIEGDRTMQFRASCCVTAGILVAVILLGSATPALGALDEKDVINDINDTIAVLHGLHIQIFYIEQNLEVVRAARTLTLRQYEAQKKLYERVLASGDEKRAAVYKYRLSKLKKHMDNIDKYDFEKMFGERIAKLNKGLAKVHIDLDVRVLEYETIFGKKPYIDMSFMRDLEKRKGKRKDVEEYLDLN